MFDHSEVSVPRWPLACQWMFTSLADLFLLGTLPHVTWADKVTEEQVTLWRRLNKTQLKTWTELSHTLTLVPNDPFVLRYFVLSSMGEIINQTSDPVSPGQFEEVLTLCTLYLLRSRFAISLWKNTVKKCTCNFKVLPCWSIQSTGTHPEI